MGALEIKEGQEYSIYRTNEITREDIFWEGYVKCGKILESIVKSIKKSTAENVNNIIAFCGDRGMGKTSAMVNFGEEITMRRESSQILSEEVKDINFIPLAKQSSNGMDNNTEDLVIDPTILDGAHGLLDIVLPSLFDMVKNRWAGLSSAEKNDSHIEEMYDGLMVDFQDVYRDLAVLETSDCKRNYEEEIYYNSDRLNDLSSAIDLKMSIRMLFKKCSEFLGDSNRIFVLMIDDVDLCSANAYRVLEEIRKYLQIPQLVILMAIRIEQMEMCIREKNYGEFENLLKYEKDSTSMEIETMAYKYLLKVLPDSHRINLSNSAIVEEVIFSDSSEAVGIEDYLKDIIDERTDIYFQAKNLRAIRPHNLRSLVNFLVFFHDLDENTDVEKNTEYVLEYFKNHLVKDDEFYNRNYLGWIDVIDAPANWLIDNINALLNLYNLNHQIKNLSDLLKWGDYKSSKEEKVVQLLLAICAFKVGIVVSLSIEKIMDVSFWRCILEGKNSYHVHINTKKVLQILSRESCDWLNENSGQNAGKLSCKISAIPEEKMTSWAKHLYSLLLFTDVNVPVVSKTSSSFINKDLEIGFDNFLINIYDIDKFAEKTGLDYYFDKNDDAEASYKDDAIEEIASTYENFSSEIVRLVTNIFHLYEMMVQLENGRGYKEKYKTRGEAFLGGVNRLIKELNNKLSKEDGSQKELNKAYSYYQNLCEMCNEALEGDFEEENLSAERVVYEPVKGKKITGVPSYLRGANVSTVRNYIDLIESQVNRFRSSDRDYWGLKEFILLVDKYEKEKIAVKKRANSLDKQDYPDAELRKRYKTFFLAAYHILNFGSKNDEGQNE